MGRHGAAFSLIVAAFLATACGSTPPPARHTTTPVSVESPTKSGRLHFHELTTITRTQTVQSLWVWGGGRYIAWAEGPSNAPVILLYDRTSGQTRALLRGPTAAATFYPVRGEGDTVVAVEEPDMPNDAQPNTTWQIVAVDVTTGHVVVVRKSPRPTPGTLVPSPEFDGRWVVWEQPQGDTVDTTNLMSFDMRTGRTLTLATRVPYAGPGVEDGVVYYRQQRADSADLFRVAADGSTPAVQLTHSGKVGGIVVRNGGLAWNQPPTGDPSSIWYMALGSTTPAELLSPANQAFPGRGFVVYVVPPDDGQLLAVATAHAGGDALPLSTGFPGNLAGWSVDGDIVVWAEPHPGPTSTTVIHVAEVGAS